ncbi:GDP-mannose 6-dehydrogenase [Caldicellulosiruptor saccharolyticus DSM 8903]|uniref:GDP-mannose 6-dehydrogenase n=1 Tax=Caldicellulosiruptor saccharolyticus (strain ATCC 43494 / DSM 8903 / Tp8T 6331) TaxID=351627 RepID=A4XM03_CALS8|nr:nucleotide sugar dehydrogenase [Caldicellulosiruptor saccharolyticus]ABP67938.1 GDP-mannose 6-dehydrogenase [Caldicellulosiruptor saccharolyticus DSM 8903]
MNNVCVIGLGYVGLPLALSFAMKGYKVYGVDSNPELISELQRGETHHLESYKGRTIQEILKDHLQNGNFIPMLDYKEAMQACDDIIVTVPIPVYGGKPYYEYLISCAKEIKNNLRKNQLIVLRSTVVPGTTRNVFLPILEESGLKCGKDFYLAYASERIAEGRAFEEFENMPTALAGFCEVSTKRAVDLIKVICKEEVVVASSVEVVETAKVLENLQRDINIAMVNEFERFTKAMNLDIFEVIKVANTHKRVNLLYPGPGVGGFCIPNAFYYLNAKAEEMGVELKLSKTARLFNQGIPAYISDLVIKTIEKYGAKKKVAVLGIAMKDYSSDDRLSPALEIIEILRQRGVEVKAFDPAVKKEYDFKVKSFTEALEDVEVVLILARQHGIEFDKIFEYIPPSRAIVIDTRDVFTQQDAKEKGFILEKI